jgi:hypothetical protein
MAERRHVGLAKLHVPEATPFSLSPRKSQEILGEVYANDTTSWTNRFRRRHGRRSGAAGDVEDSRARLQL